MFSFIPKLTDTETYVKGRSADTANALLESAGKRGLEVRTTSHGYIVPTELLPEGHELETFTAADRPAVPTEPGTSTSVEEVNNVGQAATAVADAKTAEAQAAADGSDASVEAVDAGVDAGTEDSDPAAGEDTGTDGAKEFDPTSASIAEVKEYLDGADAAERERVLAVEAASEKPRKGVADLAVTSEGAK